MNAFTSSSDIDKERQSLQAEFDMLSSEHAENVILQTKSRYYEEGDKAGRLLALQLRHESNSHLIPQIRMPSGVTTDPLAINDHFKDYYSSLSASELTTDNSGFNSFFSTLDIPTVESDLVDQLEALITI